MAKEYKHMRFGVSAYKQLRKVKNLYELQDDREYNWDEIILKLIDERTSKQFKLPLDIKQ
jgi:hypothetical protein